MRLKMVARHLRPVPVVAVAAVGPYEVTALEAWEHLEKLLIKHGARAAGQPVFALLKDLPHEVSAEQRRLELCAQVDDQALQRLRQDAVVLTFSGGDYLSLSHNGSYAQLPKVFGQMYAACSLDMSITLDARRPRVIVFKNDPAMTAPDALQVEICMPVIQHVADQSVHAA